MHTEVNECQNHLERIWLSGDGNEINLFMNKEI